jgi:hypothetical protein
MSSSPSGSPSGERLFRSSGPNSRPPLAFLVDSLVTDQPWARKYLAEQRNAIHVSRAREVLEHLRSPERVETVTESRRQLALGAL